MSRSLLYDRIVASAGDCAHEVKGGDIVRPWCNTPACALCRRRHPATWRTIERILRATGAAAPLASVTPINERKLW